MDIIARCIQLDGRVSECNYRSKRKLQAVQMVHQTVDPDLLSPIMPNMIRGRFS